LRSIKDAALCVDLDADIRGRASQQSRLAARRASQAGNDEQQRPEPHAASRLAIKVARLLGRRC
jgi:hypothetical protein